MTGISPVGSYLDSDFTSQDATTYKGAIDGNFRVGKRFTDDFAPRQHATPQMLIYIDPGHIFDAGASTLSESLLQISPTFTAPTVHPRIDRLVLSRQDASVIKVAGTEASSPVPPAVPQGCVPLCQIVLQTTTTAITNSMIIDERDFNGLGMQPVMGFTGQVGISGTHTCTAADNGKMFYNNAGNSALLVMMAFPPEGFRVGLYVSDPAHAVQIQASSGGQLIVGGGTYAPGPLTLAPYANEIVIVEGQTPGGSTPNYQATFISPRTLIANGLEPNSLYTYIDISGAGTFAVNSSYQGLVLTNPSGSPTPTLNNDMPRGGMFGLLLNNSHAMSLGIGSGYGLYLAGAQINGPTTLSLPASLGELLVIQYIGGNTFIATTCGSQIQANFGRMPIFTSSAIGFVPASGTPVGNILYDNATWAAPPNPITKYASSPTAITASTYGVGHTDTFAHGLGAEPFNYDIFLVCQSAEANWSPGEEFKATNLGFVVSSSFVAQFALSADATNVKVTTTNNASGSFVGYDKSTGAAATLTNANWKFQVRAWL